MDQIHVSVDGLNDSYNTLQTYMEQMRSITNTYTKLLSGCYEQLDETFRKDVKAHADAYEEFQRVVNRFTQENQSAIVERTRALANYCSTTYQKQSI